MTAIKSVKAINGKITSQVSSGTVEVGVGDDSVVAVGTGVEVGVNVGFGACWHSVSFVDGYALGVAPTAFLTIKYPFTKGHSYILVADAKQRVNLKIRCSIQWNLNTRLRDITLG